MVAGGMRRRTSGSLADRVAGTPSVASPGPPAVKHCWVVGPDGRHAGLLLAWRQGAGGWQGRVVHPVLEPAGWVVVEEWVPAAMLAALDSPGP